MSWNRTGTVSVTNGSPVVIGAGTAWVANARVSEAFKGPDGQLYEIAAINADGQMTLASPYLGATAGGQSYVIVPTQGYIRDLAAQAAALINQFADVVNQSGAGKFPPGAANSASVRGINDDDTGVNFPGNNILQLVTAGAARATIGADGTASFSGSINTPSTVYSLGSFAGYGSFNAPAYAAGEPSYGWYVQDGKINFRCQNATLAMDAAAYLTCAGVTAGQQLISPGLNFITTVGGPGGIVASSGDGASLAGANVQVKTWFGFGISPTGAFGLVPMGENSHVFDARTGNSQFRGDLNVSGGGKFGVHTWAPNFAYSFARNSTSDGNQVCGIGDMRGPMVRFFTYAGADCNTAAQATVYVNSAPNGRSINLGGTVNASGSDYAEYHRRCVRMLAAGLLIAKGQIVGFDAADELTDRWSEAEGKFGIKSTNPSYVGGDTWGDIDEIGIAAPTFPEYVEPAHEAYEPPAKPAYVPELGDDATPEQRAIRQMQNGQIDAQYEIDLAAYQDQYARRVASTETAAKAAYAAGPLADYEQAKLEFEAAHEVARQKVDRIAYSGRVPVNVQGASPGDYIVAEEGPADTIIGQVVTASAMRADMSQYLRVVGRVRAIEPDTGRAIAAVVIH